MGNRSEYYSGSKSCADTTKQKDILSCWFSLPSGADLNTGSEKNLPLSEDLFCAGLTHLANGNVHLADGTKMYDSADKHHYFRDQKIYGIFYRTTKYLKLLS